MKAESKVLNLPRILLIGALAAFVGIDLVMTTLDLRVQQLKLVQVDRSISLAQERCRDLESQYEQKLQAYLDQDLEQEMEPDAIPELAAIQVPAP